MLNVNGPVTTREPTIKKTLSTIAVKEQKNDELYYNTLQVTTI